MTATLAPQLERLDAESVATTLSLVHDQWMERIGQLLVPVTSPNATFWERWGAVRFLADQFEARLRLESELVRSLADLLTPSSRSRLAAAREALEHTRGELMGVGRRHGAQGQAAQLARQLLDDARHWCASVEIATVMLPVDDLPAESRELLDHLSTAAGLGL